MLERLRKPFLIAALILIIIVVSVEMGSTGILTALAPAADSGQAAVSQALEGAQDILPEPIRQQVEDKLEEAEEEEDDDVDQTLLDLADTESPGLAIRYLALVDGIVLFTTILIVVGVLMPESIQGKVQGILTLVVGILLVLAAIGMIFAAIAKLILMVSLLLAVPFGTIAYLAVYASFPRGLAATILGLLLTLKLLFGGGLILAHQRFLQNRGLVLLILSALLANVVVTFLHGFVPGILVSITDAIGAIVVGICGALWAIFLIVGGLIATIKTLT
jgi:hypothetical protein